MEDKRDNLLMQYAGLAMQLLVALGIAAFAGIWIDRKTGLAFPLAVWLLPLTVLMILIIKAVRDTSKNNHDKKK